MVKPRTVRTIRGLLIDLKGQAMRAGRFPSRLPGAYDGRDTRLAFRCMAYNRLVLQINALENLLREVPADG